MPVFLDSHSAIFRPLLPYSLSIQTVFLAIISILLIFLLLPAVLIRPFCFILQRSSFAFPSLSTIWSYYTFIFLTISNILFLSINNFYVMIYPFMPKIFSFCFFFFSAIIEKNPVFFTGDKQLMKNNFDMIFNNFPLSLLPYFCRHFCRADDEAARQKRG